MTASRRKTAPLWAMTLLGLSLVASSTGCQVSTAGQTLPSPSYNKDDLHYAAEGPEFKLPREAAAMKSYQADADARR